MDFVAENSNKLQKLGLEGKFSWALNMFTWLNLEIFNSEMQEIKHVFTLGTTAQATLINMKTEITKDEKLLIASHNLNQLFYLTNQRAVLILCNAFCKYNIMCTNTSPKQSSYCIKLCYSSFKTYCAVCTHGDVLGLVFKRMHTLV